MIGIARGVGAADPLEDAAVQKRDAVADGEGRLDVVRDDDGRHVQLRLQVDDHLVDLLRGDRVEAGGRLVVEDHLRLEHDGAGQADALAHAAGKVDRQEVLGVRQVDELELLTHGALDLPFRHLRMLAQRKGDVLEDGHGVEECAALEEHPEFLAHAIQLFLGEIGDVLFLDDDASRVRRLEAEHVPQSDGFSGAGAAEDDEDFAAEDGEARAAQHLLRAIGLVDVVKLDEGLARYTAAFDRRDVGHQNTRRNSLVRKKSMIKTVIAPVTTVFVVARPTPSAPPLVRRPLKQAMRPMPKPKKQVLPMPGARSLYRTVSMTLRG